MSRIYATAAEFENWPTGLNVDDLIPGGTPQQNAAQLALVMQDASGFADQLTFQPQYARQVTQTRQVTPDQYGRLRVRTPQFPLVAIVSAGYKNTSIEAYNTIPLIGITVLVDANKHEWFADDRWYGPSGWGRRPALVQYTAVLGYPNALLTADAAAGAGVLDLDDVTGIAIGDTLTGYDGPSMEVVFASAVTPSGAPTQVNGIQQQPGTVTLSGVTLYAHNAGVRVSELPGAISTATILIASYFIKGRRAGGGFTMRGETKGTAMDTSDDFKTAQRLLAPFAVVQP